MFIEVKPNSVPQRALIRDIGSSNVSVSSGSNTTNYITITATCQELIKGGQAVYVDNGKAWVATTNGSFLKYACGIAIAGGDVDSTITIQTNGIYSNENYSFTNYIVRLCENAVNVTSEQLQNVTDNDTNLTQILGTAINTTTLMINIEQPIILAM